MALATGLLLGERLAPAALAGGLLVLGAVVTLYLRRAAEQGAGPPIPEEMVPPTSGVDETSY